MKLGASLTTMNNQALVEAFERAGLEFVPEEGEEAGVRLVKQQDASTRSQEPPT